ncbi:Outer dense fiber protein 3 [Pteropus alecto]|uniref:Outer dense fiber protein 3 n=1 Tax=Pteropus alecto TaxID=9402 RepID=L5K6X1_PTEAL|nr:Outer dense fiber protein 3 [Pteropus alecto]
MQRRAEQGGVTEQRSMGSTQEEDRRRVGCETPGPAAYRQTDVQVTKFKAPQYTMAARVEPPGDKTLKPGPGAHSPEKVTMTKPCAPIVTFGIKHSDYMTPLVVDVD